MLQALTQDLLLTLIAFLLSCIRLYMVLSFAPFLSKRSFTSVSKYSFIFALAIIIFPGVLITLSEQELTNTDFFMLILKEALLGLLIGCTIWIPMKSATMAGVIIDTQRGATMSEDFNPSVGEQSTPIGVFLSQCLTTYLFVSGAFLLIIEFVYSSFTLWPVGDALPSMGENIQNAYLNIIGNYFVTAIYIAAPISGFLLLIELSMIILAKRVQEFNPMVIGSTLKSGFVFFIIIFYIDMLLYGFSKEFSNFLFEMKLIGSHE